MTKPLNFAELAIEISQRMAGQNRLIVAVVGPPGAGKSTLAARLAAEMNSPDLPAIVVPMDGFHFDNAILERRGDIARKGAPHTFDVDGFASLLERLRGEPLRDIAIPAFDRSADLARNAADEVLASHRLVLIEGNYLLLNAPGWRALRPCFDMTIGLEVEMDVLEQRLVQRWLDHGMPPAAARARARQNDLPNARMVLEQSQAPDYVLRETD